MFILTLYMAPINYTWKVDGLKLGWNEQRMDIYGHSLLRDCVFNFQLRVFWAVSDFFHTYVFECRFEKFRKQSGLSFPKKCNPFILEGPAQFLG